MDHHLTAPIGFTEVNAELPHEQQGTSKAIAPEESGHDRSDQQVVQRAEDNPRPAAPKAAGDASLETPAVPPVLQPIDAIPPTFSQSSWARRNARIQAARRWIPAPIVSKMKIFYVFLFALWLIVTPVIFLVGPPSLAMVIGNRICKAANLPHLPRTITAFSIGAAGGWVGTVNLFGLSWFFGHFLVWLDGRARVWHIRSGRILATSTRPDGHFPVVLLWIPFLYPSAIVGSAIGTGFRIPNAKDLKQGDINRMSCIGAAIAMPTFVLFICLYLIVSGMINDFFVGVMQGFPVKDEPIFTFGYLYRQMEALVWLLSPRKTVVSSAPGRTGVP